MAIIYTYPSKSNPSNDDLIVITDVSDSNKTKVARISDLPGGATSGVSSVTVGTHYTSSGDPITISPTTGAVIVTLGEYDGGSNVGYVPDGGSNTTFLRGDGTWATPAASPGDPVNSVQFNNAGSFGGDADFTYDSTNNILTVSNIVESDLNGAVLQKVYNNTLGTLAKGQVVYLSGGNNGDIPHVELALASSASTMPALGIVRENISASTEGEVVVSGELTGLNLTGFTTGDDLFVSNTIAGGIQTTSPRSEANLIQKIGKVIKGGSGGAISVLGAFRANATPNLNEGSIFIGDAANESSTLAIGGSGTVLKSNGTTATWSTDDNTTYGLSVPATQTNPDIRLTGTNPFSTADVQVVGGSGIEVTGNATTDIVNISGGEQIIEWDNKLWLTDNPSTFCIRPQDGGVTAPQSINEARYWVDDTFNPVPGTEPVYTGKIVHLEFYMATNFSQGEWVVEEPAVTPERTAFLAAQLSAGSLLLAGLPFKPLAHPISGSFLDPLGITPTGSCLITNNTGWDRSPYLAPTIGKVYGNGNVVTAAFSGWPSQIIQNYVQLKTIGTLNLIGGAQPRSLQSGSMVLSGHIIYLTGEDPGDPYTPDRSGGPEG